MGKSINDRALRVLTARAASLIAIDKEQMKRELMQSIKKAVSMPRKAPDRRRLEAEIENLRKKKIRIIDLAAEGAISAEDMKAQNAAYTARIAELTARLAEAENAGGARLPEATRMEEYEKRVDTLLNMEPDDDCTLKEALRKAVVFPNGVMDIYLNYVPFGIRLWYKTSGKLDFFKVEVTKLGTVDSDAQF